jgi:hypothetical protein
MARPQRYFAFAWIVLADNADAHDWYTGKTDPVPAAR